MNGFILKMPAVMLSLFAALTGTATAAVFTYELNIVAEGTAPGGSTPWITAVVADNDPADGNVRLQLIAGNLSGNERIDSWSFNLNPSLDPTLLTFTVVSAETTVPNPPTTANGGVTTGINNQDEPGVMGFDIQFDFINNINSGFVGGLVATYDVSSSGGPLTAADFFSYLNQPTNGPSEYNSAAHIIGLAYNKSGTIASVPEPGHAIFGALLLCGLLWIERKRVQSFFRRRREAT